jgi:type II secretory pathway component PulJ
VRGNRTASPRLGLTLLEVLLAASLGLILISAIYAALEQAWRLNVQGKVELQRNQIARAVLRQMELDIRAVMFASQAASTVTADTSAETTSTTASTSSTGSAASSSSDTTSSGETEDEWTGSLGIRGNNTELWIDLSHVSREMEFAATSSNTTAVRNSDLQTVAYFLTGSAVLTSALADTDAGASPITVPDTDGIGLARSQGERSVLRTLNDTGSESVLPGPSQMLAPEIESILFRYFDGLTWYDEWDSSTSGALPRAIEITIGFEPPPNLTGYLLTPAMAPGTDSYRMVIAVPVSDPMPAEGTY